MPCANLRPQRHFPRIRNRRSKANQAVLNHRRPLAIRRGDGDRSPSFFRSATPPTARFARRFFLRPTRSLHPGCGRRALIRGQMTLPVSLANPKPHRRGPIHKFNRLKGKVRRAHGRPHRLRQPSRQPLMVKGGRPHPVFSVDRDKFPRAVVQLVPVPKPRRVVEPMRRNHMLAQRTRRPTRCSWFCRGRRTSVSRCRRPRRAAPRQQAHQQK